MGAFKDANREMARKNIEKQLADGKITQDEYNRRIARLETTGVGIDKENQKPIRNTMAKQGVPTQEQVANAAAMKPPTTAAQGNKGLADIGMRIGRFANDVSAPFEARPQVATTDINTSLANIGLTPEQIEQVLAIFNQR